METHGVFGDSLYSVGITCSLHCRKWLLNGIDNELYSDEEEEIPEELLNEDLGEANVVDYEEVPETMMSEEEEEEGVRERVQHTD